jgi:pyruvate dehydrogenase (quinone)
LAALLNDSARVTMFCGAGCAGAHAEVMALAKRLKAPIVHTLRGKEHIEYDNPHDVGMTGLVGFRVRLQGDEELRHAADSGHRLSLSAVLPGGRDHRADRHLGRKPWATGVRSISALLAAVKETIGALLPALAEKTDTSHLDDALADYKKARRDLDALAESSPNSKQIHPQYVTRLVSELAADDAIFTCDVGTPIGWTARYLKVNGKRRIVGSFNHGSMANAMLHAIGAQAAFPERQVVSFSGDGGFSMMMGDFITLIQAAAGEDHSAQQRNARLRRDGDEGRRLPRHRL